VADDLRDSPFLGERVINFVASILRSSVHTNGAVMNPINDFEKKLLVNQDKVRAIDSELNKELLKLLKDSKEYIPPHTAMRVLLFGLSKGFLDKAYEIVYFAARDRLVLTDEEINTIVFETRKDPELQVQWLMTLYAGDKAEEPTSTGKSVKLPIDFQ
jgi:hypothetical protein